MGLLTFNPIGETTQEIGLRAYQSEIIRRLGDFEFKWWVLKRMKCENNWTIEEPEKIYDNKNPTTIELMKNVFEFLLKKL